MGPDGGFAEDGLLQDPRLQMCLETFCRERMTHGQSLLQIISMRWSRTALATPREPLGFGRSRNDFLQKFGMLTKYANNPDLHRPDDRSIPSSVGELKPPSHQCILLS